MEKDMLRVIAGSALVKATRADDGLETTPVPMMTTEAKQENIAAAFQAGLNNYLVQAVPRGDAAGKTRQDVSMNAAFAYPGQ